MLDKSPKSYYSIVRFRTKGGAIWTHIRKQLEQYTATLCRTNGLYGRWAKQNGLNYNEFLVLDELDYQESCTQAQICEAWLLPKQTVHSVLVGLRQEGLVQQEPDPADGRGKLLRLTPAGKDYARRLLSPLDRIEERVMERMGPLLAQQLLETTQLYCTLLEEELDHESLG